MAGCIAHARNGRISTSGLKSDVIILFIDPDFRQNTEISAIQPLIRVMLHIFIAHARNGRIFTSGLKCDVIIVFLDPDFCKNAKITANSHIFKRDIGLLNICMNFQDLLAQ